MKADILLCILPPALALDLILPFLLAPACRGYSHTRQVMSSLGSFTSPLHRIYNLWLILLGLLILAGCIRLYPVILTHSQAGAAALTFVMAAYALGGCILSGIFKVGETKTLETTAEKIHGYGSVIGFLLLALAPAFVSLYYFKTGKNLFGCLSLLCFAAAVTFFTLFVMSDKPRFQGTAIALEGLWQRLTLLFMYLPIALVCMHHST